MPDKEDVNEKAPEQNADATAETGAAEAEGEMDKALEIEGLAVEVREIGPCKIEVKLDVPQAAVDAEMGKAFDELTPNAVVHGFRKGHAPRKLVERHYHDAVFGDLKLQLVARAWEQAKKEKDFRPLGDPELTDDSIKVDEEKGIHFEATIEIAPKFELGEYKGLKLEKPSVDVADEDIDKALDNLRRRNAVLEPVEKGKTKEDDVPVIDVDIKVNGEVIQSVSDQEFRLSKDNWLRGIDEEFWKDLLGKKAGDAATKTVTLPDGYQKEEFRGKEAELTATIKDIKRPKLPELSEDFAKDMLFESLDELKQEIRTRLADGKEQEAHAALSRQVEEKMLGMVGFELPADLVKAMAERNLARQQIQLMYRGVPRDEIERAADEMAAGSQQQAERDMRTYFIYQQIAEKEGIEVSDAEVERRIALLAQYQGVTPARMRENLRKQNSLGELKLEIRDRKTIDFLIGKAEVRSADAGEAAPKKSKKSSKKSKPEAGDAEDADSESKEE